MNILISLIVIIGTMVAALHVRSTLRRIKRKHAIEYYLGWGGYWHPIGLQNRITKEEADAYAAELSPKIGDGGNREGGISWGCLTPPLLHQAVWKRFSYPDSCK